jgi:hypothetical protein
LSHIVARAIMGVRDLYHGCPCLKGAKISNVVTEETEDDLIVTLILRDVKGVEHSIAIKQER